MLITAHLDAAELRAAVQTFGGTTWLTIADVQPNGDFASIDLDGDLADLQEAAARITAAIRDAYTRQQDRAQAGHR